jgi:hypothetical protein
VKLRQAGLPTYHDMKEEEEEEEEEDECKLHINLGHIDACWLHFTHLLISFQFYQNC